MKDDKTPKKTAKQKLSGEIFAKLKKELEENVLFFKLTLDDVHKAVSLAQSILGWEWRVMYRPYYGSVGSPIPEGARDVLTLIAVNEFNPGDQYMCTVYATKIPETYVKSCGKTDD